MDFLKTLLVYMGLTFATTVQGAPTPEITPVPTPTAVVAEQTLPSPEQATPSPTPYTADASAEATATPVMITSAPAPTMTPNPAYKTLQSGDRGESVKTLQQRLKDLGYLTGDVDGAYGNQTRRAVLRFQYYNGLSQDGVAGKRTQTVLFESAEVIASPDLATATAEPSATPATTEAASETLAPADAASTAEVASLSAEPSTAVANVSAEPNTLLDNAAIVLNDAGDKLHALVQVDGVQVDQAPALYMGTSGQILLPLSEVANCIDGWTFTKDTDTQWTLVCAGYTLRIYATFDASGAPDSWTVQADDDALEIVDGEIYLTDKDELLLSTTVLTRAIGAECVWDSEEVTLMIRVTDKAVAQAAD